MDLGGGVKRSKFIFFLEHGHVAYQINGNHECSNMVANIFAADLPPDTVGVVGNVKIQLLQNMVMCVSN